jgi:hypothetical protein
MMLAMMINVVNLMLAGSRVVSKMVLVTDDGTQLSHHEAACKHTVEYIQCVSYS